MTNTSKKFMKETKIEDNSSNSEAEEESMSEDDMINKEIQIDFEARTPDDSDFHGIRRLLRQLFLKAHIDLSELSGLLIQQNYVCSVIKQDINDDDEEDDESEDEDFGMISVINLTEKKDIKCVEQLRDFLIDRCKEVKSDVNKLQYLLDNCQEQVGLILSERFVNIPPKIALPLYENLKMDMKKAVEKKLKFDFSSYLLISKIYKQPESKNNSKEENIIYANAEEELLAEEAEFQFDYSVATESDTGLGGQWMDTDSEWKPHRRVLWIPSTKWDIIMQKLQSEFS